MVNIVEGVLPCVVMLSYHLTSLDFSQGAGKCRLQLAALRASFQF